MFTKHKFCILPFPKWQILDSIKLKELADDNFKFDKNGRKFSKWGENTAEKGEIAISPVPKVFSRDMFWGDT